jgi:outer membrane protein assembly factor BamD (BamD/ComL family)
VPEAEAEASAAEARTTFEEATRLYEEGQYRRAIIRFERVRQTPGMSDEVRSACLYNIGRANLRLNRFATAIVYLEEYLTMPGADIEDAQVHLREARGGAGVERED